MSGDVTAVREWMNEGDRLLAQAYAHLDAAAADPAQAELAREYFSRAAQTYVGGAVAYQRGSAAVAPALPETDALIDDLTGRLRAEVTAAKRASAGNATTSTAAAQAFAEAVRERFSRAVPEAFSGPSSRGAERDLPVGRSQ